MVKALIATGEATPLAKTGGLADVCGALPAALREIGHEATLILPAYRCALKSCLAQPTGQSVDIPVGNKLVPADYIRTTLPGTDVPVLLVQQDQYFDREGLYGEGDRDYRDNCERFVFFSRAVLEAIRLFDLDIDIIHCNDWQTGLIPVYLQTEYRVARAYERIASLFTIHNLAYQGRFWHWDMLLTGLDWNLFNWRQLEFYGDLNLMKAGIVFADQVSTVSPRYAEEIQDEPFGCGLDGLLLQRRDKLTGILNGIDDTAWSPAIDDYLPVKYTHENWREGKAAARRALQQKLGLADDPQAPLIGVIGRITEQKGSDLVAELIERWLPARGGQWVILGSGQPAIEQQLTQLAHELPHQVAFQNTFSEELAHQIEAASDIFLMPSRFEPCGLSQFYSLKYGAVPVVHATGGLADTIVDANAETMENGTANGFSFEEFSVASCWQALARACQMREDQPDQWARLVETGMQQDWSWHKSATEYAELYGRIISETTEAACA